MIFHQSKYYTLYHILFQQSRSQGSLSLFNIFVRFKIGSNTVSYRLPNSVYQLTEQELALEVAFNEFTSGEVQVSDIGSCMNTL